eukprot:gene31566-38151_t
MNNVKAIENLKEEELKHNIIGGITKGSWHDKYKDSAWIFLGGFAYELTEGDIICVMSQWGEVEDIHLVREQETNKSKGFAFVKYEDSRSTILAVDNFNGISLLGRTLRCDHVENYKLPKHIREGEEEKLKAHAGRVEVGPGHAYKGKELASDYTIQKGMDLWSQENSRKRPAGGEDEDDEQDDSSADSRRRHSEQKESSRKDKKDRHDKKKHRKSHKHRRGDSEDEQRRRRRSRSRSRSRDHARNNSSSSSSRPSQPSIPTADLRERLRTVGEAPVTSWRGHRDPALMHAAPRPFLAPPAAAADGRLPEKRRDEFSGIGGYNRLR